MAGKVNLTETAVSFLAKLDATPRGLLGPPPDYQGDLIHISGPELNTLLQRKMIGRRALAHPRDGEGHKSNPPYLKITHRFKILKAGRALLASRRDD